MMFQWDMFFGCHIQPAHQQQLSPEAHLSEMFKLAHFFPVVVETCESFVVAVFSRSLVPSMLGSTLVVAGLKQVGCI